MFIMALVIALVVASVVVTAECMFGTTITKLSFNDWMRAVTIGCVVGIANFLVSGADLLLAAVLLIALIAVTGYLVYWWHQEGSELKEMWPFAVVMIPIFLVMKAAAAKVMEIIDQPFWGSVVFVIPTIVVLIAAGLIVADFFNFRATEMDVDTSDEGVRTMQLHHIGVVASLAIMAVLIAGVVCNAINWSAIGGPEEVHADGTDGTGWAYFYNEVVRNDDDEDNDFNFGPKPAANDAEGYDTEFRSRLMEDPALGAADMAWLDAIVGTRYLGEFYESCKGDWAKTINQSKEAFINDQILYSNTREAFFKYLDKATVSVEEASDLEDQMYMNGYTKDGIPDVIVLKTKNHTGKFLVYTFKIKGNTFKVAYRIECGFQPTNVQKVMGIKPQSTPKKTPKKPSNPGRGDGSKPSKPSKPGKGDNGKPSYNKDPDKAPKENTEPNDDKGPGPDTNNPDDPRHSTKDTPDSSTSGSYKDYRDNIEKLEETNKDQKTGNDSNKPSTPKPTPDTKVDNNGDKGTGNGGANDPTPVKEKPKDESGKPIDDKPGEAWEGPSD